MRRIGLIGGVSWSATATYYQYLNQEVQNRLGGNHSADLAIRSLDFETVLQLASDHDAIEDLLIDAGHDVIRCGAELLGIAALSGHVFASHLHDLPAEFIDLVDIVADELSKRGIRSAGLLTTSVVLNDDAMMRRLAANDVVRLIKPSPDSQERLDEIIFEELTRTRFSDEAGKEVSRVSDELVTDGAEIILLGTTDLSRVAGQVVAGRPVIDVAELHCRRLIDLALSARA